MYVEGGREEHLLSWLDSLLQSNFNGVIIIVVPKRISIYPSTNMSLLFQHCTFTPYISRIDCSNHCHPLAHACILSACPVPCGGKVSGEETTGWVSGWQQLRLVCDH